MEGAVTTCTVMYVDKVILMIFLYAMSVCCSDETVTRNARTISSLFAWPQMLFRDRPNFSILPRLNQVQIREWIRDDVARLLRFASFASSGKGPMRIVFGPEDGPRAAAEYQRRYGYRGERLIKQLGIGFDPDRQQLAPSTFLTPPPPPIRRVSSL